jgi:hypothetical protein
VAVADRQSKHGGYHHCPNGHLQGWSKDVCEDEKMRRERDLLKQETARLEESITAERRLREEAEMALRKHKKRAAAGVCPCCTRTFSNMARHMKTKHPDYNVVPLKAKSA